MLVFVTGATGFVGHHVADALRGAGHTVRCLVRDPSRARLLAEAGDELVAGDVGDAAALARGVAGAAAVVHVAGLIAARSAREMFAVNVAGTARLATACARAELPPARFVLVSSLAAGGPSGPHRAAVREDDAPRPVSVYGLSKLRGEEAARRALGSATALTVLRPPAVYGPHDRGILELFRAAAAGVRLRIGTRPRRVSIVHGADLADAVVRALDGPAAAGRTYYVANPEAHAMDALLARIGAAVGRRGVALPLPECAVRAAGVVAEEVARLRGRVPTFSRDKAREFLAPGWVCDPARAALELDWTPRWDLDEGLAATAAWYRAAGWLGGR